MARINLEDSIYKDGRFIDLCIKLGSKWTALGAIVEAWAFAQDFVEIENPCGIAPLEDWKKKKICDAIIDVDLAEIRGNSIYVRGSEHQFKWLVDAKVKGKKGGDAKASTAKPSHTPAKLGLPSSSSSSSKELIHKSALNAEAEAKKCLDAIQRFGPHESKSIREFVGDELFVRVQSKIGWQAIREMKRDTWTLKNITNQLGV